MRLSVCRSVDAGYQGMTRLTIDRAYRHGSTLTNATRAAISFGRDDIHVAAIEPGTTLAMCEAERHCGLETEPGLQVTDRILSQQTEDGLIAPSVNLAAHDRFPMICKRIGHLRPDQDTLWIKVSDDTNLCF
jgi:hypothetical protein